MRFARKLPADCPQKPERKWVAWEGRKIPLLRERDGWRLRSRGRYLSVDVVLPVTTEAAARKLAREALACGHAKIHTRRSPGKATLRDLAQIYLDAPKRTATLAARSNVSRLRAIVETAWGRGLEAVRIREIGPRLWSDYQRKRYEAIGRSLDYTQRTPENASINAAVRGARCLFIRRLRPVYEAQGLFLPADAELVTWLPEPILTRPEADDAGLAAAWRGLDRGALWFVVGLARFAGLRLGEIGACRRSWIVEVDGAVSVELRDRPEDGYQHKTGVPYKAPVLDPALAAALLSCPEGLIVQPDAGNRQKWLYTAPQKWVRPFVGEAIKPLHRLRGLYASELAERTQTAVAAQLAGQQAAASALGHTTTETTRRHYL